MQNAYLCVHEELKTICLSFIFITIHKNPNGDWGKKKARVLFEKSIYWNSIKKKIGFLKEN